MHIYPFVFINVVVHHKMNFYILISKVHKNSFCMSKNSNSIPYNMSYEEFIYRILQSLLCAL